jgi:predicted amidohydrolase
MKLGLLQFSPVWEDKIASLDKVKELVGHLDEPVELLILPEMSLTGFTMNPQNFAEGIGGKTFRFFSELALEKKINVFVGIIEDSKNKFYNTLLHIDSRGKLVKLYRKIHPFSYSSEDKYYAAGARPAITKIKKFRIGLSICYDLRFPELYRRYAKKKVHLIVDIANWPDTRIEHWRTLLKARAIENQCYVAGINRVGDDPKLHYNGYSSVFDPMGNELISLPDEEKIVVAEIDKALVNDVRNKLPFLDDIRLI